MTSRILLLCVLLGCGLACYGGPPPSARSQVLANAATLLQGRFDNRHQVDSTAAGDESSIPHVSVFIEPTGAKNWSLWHVHVELSPDTAFDQTWAMQARIEYNGDGALIPYYQFKQAVEPTAAAFDPQEWLSLEACALRGKFSKSAVQGVSEGEPCVAVSMNVGARRALLPVGFQREGEWLYVDFNLRSVRTRIAAAKQADSSPPNGFQKSMK